MEFKESTCPAEREGTWPDLVAELLQGEGLVCQRWGTPAPGVDEVSVRRTA